jgi:hypothetical protein
MKGSALLFSADKEVIERADCWAGAKAEAELARRAAVRVASFIMVKEWKRCVAIKDFHTVVFETVERVRTTSTCVNMTS